MHRRVLALLRLRGGVWTWSDKPKGRGKGRGGGGYSYGGGGRGNWGNRPSALQELIRANEEVTAFQDMGIDTTGWQVYTGPPRYVRSGVYGFPIRPPEHVAIVMSQSQRFSMWPYEALAHEGGHAVWWRLLDDESASSPPLWGPTAPWFEGFAYFFERLVYEPGFLSRYVPDLPADQREALKDYRARQMASLITDSIVSTLVERRLYEDPNNLAAVSRYAAETRSRFTGVPIAPSTESGLFYDSSLLSSILWNYPGYMQNYLFAHMTEAWLYEAVVAEVGDPVANKKVGPMIREKLVRGPLDVSFPDRLTLMFDKERFEPLQRYIKGPPPPPEPELPEAEAGEGQE